MASRAPAPNAANTAREARRRRGPRRRLWRWLTLGVGALVGLVGALLLGLWLLLSQLDHPWVKARVVAACRDQLGLGIDYDGVTVSLRHGVRARSLRLLTPPPLAAGAADFVRLEGLDLRAPLWRFALGQLDIERLALGRVEIALVRDAAGRTTLSELFPEPPEPEPSEPSRPSQLLAELPRATIDSLVVEAIAVRAVELGPDGTQSSVALGDMRASGEVHSQGRGLLGTTLALSGDPLVLQLIEPSGTRRAEAALSIELGAPADASVELRARLALREQDLVPAFSASSLSSGELLALDATATFDAAAGKTSLSVAPLRAFGDAVALDAQGELLDQNGLSARLGGTAHLALAGSPLALPGLGLESLAMDATARELSWDGARLTGDIDARGRLGELSLEREASRVRLEEVTLLALGTFEPTGGRLHATLGAAGAELAQGGAVAALADVSLILGASARDAAGAQQLETSATLSLDTARVSDGSGGALAIAQPRLRSVARGPTAELAAGRVPWLELDLSAVSLTQSGGGQRALLERPSASAVVERLVLDESSATGARGDATLALRLPSVRVSEGRQTTARARGLELSASTPLALDSLKGSLVLESLAAQDRKLGGLALELEVTSPLAWGPGAGGAQALARGRLARFDVGGASGALEELRVLGSRAEQDRYGLELDARGTRLSVAGQALPPLQASVRAQVAPSDGSSTLTANLAGARGGSLKLETSARFDRGTEVLSYDLGVSARELESFAEAASGLDRRAARLNLQGARLSASARGTFGGVLRTGPSGWPEPAPNPLRTARGQQSAQVELEGLDYRGASGSLRVPRLAFELDSKSGDGGRGNASARLSIPALELDGGGSSLRLGGLTQELSASFERAPDQGIVDVNTSLELASAAQSFAPGVPVRDLRLTSRVQIDRLRSIFLRELSLDNPASGSGLRAAGTLELLAQAGQQSNATLAGREALFFEGRLAQRLEPFEKLGIASHASGSLEVPFRLESGALLGYRLLAALEAQRVSWVSADGALALEGLTGTIPVVEEFALLESGPVISAGPRTSPLSDTRFFDVHPFLAGHDYITADSIRFGAMQPLGPIAANVRLERSDFLIDQLQAGYSGGQIVGQVRVAYRDGDPIVRMRLNATGVRSGKKQEVFDANTALTFVPRAMTLEGKAQIVRASREHLEDILDVIDPFHESANANRVRRGLALGYPKFVRFALHDGAVDTKVELGGLAELVRIDEIKAVPLGPILQKYVAPALADYLKRAPPIETRPAAAPDGGDLDAIDDAGPSARDEPKGRAEP